MLINQEQEAEQWKICPYCGNIKIISQTYIDKYGENTASHLGFLECITTNCQGQLKSNLNPDIDIKHPLLKSKFGHGHYYYGKCRNARVAIYNAETDKFVYMRKKFTYIFPEDIGHAENDDGFDLFQPYGEMLTPPFKIPMVTE